MKKIIISLIGLVLLCSTLSVGCRETESIPVSEIGSYAFTGISWTRETEHDTETIRFDIDGTFHYSCACGNAVNDADLCKNYTYDADAKTITLNYWETTEEIITIIKIIYCDADRIQLDFNGEIREFYS